MFSYFGSKRRLAPTYQAPQHELIVEPFAGAAGYSMYWLQQRSDLRVMLYDVDHLVVEMWETLLAMTPQQLWDYPLPEKGSRVSDPIYLAATGTGGSWQTRHAGNDYQITEWMAEGFPQARQRMAHVLSVVRGRVKIHHADYSTAPDVYATWFIDPPYQAEGHQYASSNAIDWTTLGKWCRARSGQVIVCESEGADWMEFQPHRSHRTLSGDTSTEVVWYSDPEPTLLDLVQQDEPVATTN